MPLESDTNAFHNYKYCVDSQDGGTSCGGFNSYGHDFIGQPSVIYSVPITVGDANDEETTSSYEGYSEYVMDTGSTGKELMPDMTISDSPGTGAGRLLDVTDGGRDLPPARALVAPAPRMGGSPTTAAATPAAAARARREPRRSRRARTSIDVSFASAATGVATNRFDVRYRDAPSTTATSRSPTRRTGAAAARSAGLDGDDARITGLKPQTALLRRGARLRLVRRALADRRGLDQTHAEVRRAARLLHRHRRLRHAAGARARRAARLPRQELLPTRSGGSPWPAYYSLSPPIAAAIATDERLRAGARALVRPIVDVAEAGLRAAKRVR